MPNFNQDLGYIEDSIDPEGEYSGNGDKSGFMHTGSGGTDFYTYADQWSMPTPGGTNTVQGSSATSQGGSSYGPTDVSSPGFGPYYLYTTLILLPKRFSQTA